MVQYKNTLALLVTTESVIPTINRDIKIMPRSSIDLSGKVFERWTVLGKDLNAATGSGCEARWICLCDCGITRSVSGSRLRDGGSKSCGCLAKEVATTHGMRFSPEYASWLGMRARVKPSYTERYLYYDRGIDIDPRWDASFEVFLEDMGLMPEGKYSIDRIDNDLGYWKHNCRWATDLEQAQNRRCVIRIEYLGKTQTVAEWSKETGISIIALKHRIDRGWSVEDMLTKVSISCPRLPTRYLELNGETKTAQEWAKQINIPYSVISKRIKRGWTDTEILTTPLGQYIQERGKNSPKYQKPV
jgi:hypothetical protein